MIIINQDKAIEVAKDKIRQYRSPLLSALDIEVLKNIHNTEVLATIEMQKQELRDLTNTTDGKTVDELIIIINKLSVSDA